MVRLPGYGDRKPAELSGGQRQRVALARAIVNRPKVLLLDEPLGALDLKLREQMQVELKAIQGEVGITFVYVTHDQDEALTMSDRIAVFNDGRIEQVSPPFELYEQPDERVRRRLRRRLQPARARRRAVHDPSGEDRAARDRRAGRRAADRERPDLGGRLRGHGHPLHRRARRRWRRCRSIRQNTESASAEDAGPQGQRGPGRMAPGARGRRPREVKRTEEGSP